jgi:GNAT superfamily N-acetyltransferase
MSVNEFVRTVYDRLSPDRIAPRLPPLRITDGRDREIHLRPFRPSDVDALAEMYAGLAPASHAQGVPPRGPEAIREWLSEVLEGPDVVACHDGRIVGHVGFVPDGTDRHELAIFVDDDYQRAGVGTALLGAGLGHADRKGVEYVWLSVEKADRELHRFYARAGFSVVNPMGVTHRMSRYL